MKAVYFSIDKKRRLHTFELFGYDFMIDEDLKPYLIEVNINPCLGVTSSFSSRFISTLLDNTFRIAIDPLFPPPLDASPSKKSGNDNMPEIRYELIFDQKVDGPILEKVFSKCNINPFGNFLMSKFFIDDNPADSEGEEEDYPEDELAN